jgi:ABC-type glycerol-3-phosphate transport system permease component
MSTIEEPRQEEHQPPAVVTPADVPQAQQNAPVPQRHAGMNPIHYWLRWAAFYFPFCFLAFLTTVPFVWMVFSSFKPRDEVEEVHFVPEVWSPENYAIVLRMQPLKSTNEMVQLDFKRFYFNSIFVTFAVTFFQLIACAMGAYAFSRIRWRGRDQVFLLYLATLMVPGVVLMIPNFQLMVEFGMVNSYAGLIIPSIFFGSAFGTFLLRQFMLTIPSSLDEAAAIDGASHWQIFWDLMMPLSRAGLVTLALFTMLSNYQSFFWPLVLLKSEALYTLPIGLLNLDTSFGKQTELILAATVMSTIPLVIVFIAAQKVIVRGIQMGAVKG